MMKKYTLILLTVLATFGLAQAQKKTPPTATELATKNIEAMEKKIKLNPTQRSIIYNYSLDMYKEQLDLAKKQQSGGYNEDNVTKIYKLQNETNTNIRNILKGEQQTQFDDFLEEQLRNPEKKKKKGKHEEEETVSGISGLKSPPSL